ncbi:MAG: fluoride efflux transporter CrcB [Verrucomicrobiales bacterium]|nr:fluoride efflux transporter CrcB [Verrucomicrobiales bacterium]
MSNAIWIFLGGGLGSVARWAASLWCARHVGEAFPWGTLVVNVTGSLVIGWAAWWTGPEGRWAAPAAFRDFFLVGICGGYTTFSSFSLHTLALAHDGEWVRAGANVVLSVVLCLAAVWAGHALGVALAGERA